MLWEAGMAIDHTVLVIYDAEFNLVWYGTPIGDTYLDLWEGHDGRLTVTIHA